MAIDYFNFLGTEDMSPAKKKEEFYKLGCELSVRPKRTKLYLFDRLDDNFGRVSKAFRKITC